MNTIEQKLDQVLTLAQENAKRITALAEMLMTVVERGATKDELKHLATKDDIKNMATKDDLKNFATKDDTKNMATKDDLADIKRDMATKDDIWRLDQKIDGVEERLNTTMDTQKKEIMDHIDGFLGKHISTDTEVTSLRSHARRTDDQLTRHEARIAALEEQAA
jgi:hypothetical protein